MLIKKFFENFNFLKFFLKIFSKFFLEFFVGEGVHPSG